MNMWKNFIQCSCGGHFIAISTDNDEKYDYIDLAFLQIGNANKSFILKLQHIWHIIRYGTPYIDMVCLDKKEALKFRNVLDRYIKNKAHIYNKTEKELFKKLNIKDSDTKGVEAAKVDLILLSMINKLENELGFINVLKKRIKKLELTYKDKT